MASESKTRLLRDAEKYVLQGKISNAINEYLKVVREDPEDVLVLNTIGDLHLRMGRTAEANRLFHQVAENYSRNNFLLKAIAVYRKILSSDLQNPDLNNTIASLYARQGMNVDARIQYLRIAEMCAAKGLQRECLDAYEKVIELDPMNSAVRLKLAGTYLEQGESERARLHMTGAARAQAKAGDFKAAMGSYRRALDLDPHDSEALKGYLEAALQAETAAPALEYLAQSGNELPEHIDIKELAGRAYLSIGDVKNALRCFESVLADDDTRFDNYLSVSRHLLESGDIDGAAQCLEPIVPIVISQREPHRLVHIYEEILDLQPSHVASLQKLAEIYSALNDTVQYLKKLDTLVACHAQGERPEEALACLARILQVRPGSHEHLKLHQEIYSQAYPGQPYDAPVRFVGEPPRDTRALVEVSPAAADGGEGGSNPTLIEIDLLLNYGMKEKALQHLLELETRDPYDKQVRLRLMAIYRENEQYAEAAKQCLLSAALHRRSGKEESADRLIAEAKKYAPELIDPYFDLVAFAEKHHIKMREPRSRQHLIPADATSGVEFDLSGDLSEIFFRNGESVSDLEAIETEVADTAGITEDLADAIPKRPRESLSDQLQEVDFYLRLGFIEEAQAKLAEMAKANPDHPEIASRYRQLGKDRDVRTTETSALPNAEEEPEVAADPFTLGGDLLLLQDAAESAGGFPDHCAPAIALGDGAQDAAAAEETGDAEEESAPALEDAQVQQAADLAAIAAEVGSNDMFTDLIDEVNTLTNQGIVREDFETHFSLGIAYREMQLMDEAIREFQAAIKTLDPAQSPHEIIQCCGMLSTCFLDKGMPRSAIRWCQTGLTMKGISAHERLALQYDVGVAHTLSGNNSSALECFNSVFGIDPAYRDVAQRMDDIKAGYVQPAPSDLT